MAVEILEPWKKRSFFLMAWPFTPLPPPLLMARQLREELFFAASQIHIDVFETRKA